MTGSKDSGFVSIKPAAVDLTAAAPAPEQKEGRFGKQPLLWLGTGAALLIAAVVFFLLPHWVTHPDFDPGAANSRTEPDKPGQVLPGGNASQTAGGTAAAGDAPWRNAQRFAQRKQSQEILEQLLDTQAILEDRGVTVWGRKGYEQAIQHARSGDAEYSRQNFSQAHDHYARASDILTGLLQGMEELFSDTMETGNAALAAGDAVAARESFSIALAIDPIDRTALSGMERAGTLTEVMDLIDRGDMMLREGKAEQARGLYQQALEIDGHSGRARQQLQLAESRISENAFSVAMSSGFRLLDEGRYSQAGEAFSTALRIKPGSRDARSGLDQANHRITSGNINALLKQAKTAEQNEDWQGAVSAYEAALKLDNNLGNAREGQRHAALRKEIHDRLEQVLSRPDRLFDRGAFDEIVSFRDKLRALTGPGPVLAGQLARLDRLLNLADTPVPVQFRSDNQTRVTLYKVGELGYFTAKNLSLRPGHYVAVGHRDGYRDVRVEFFVDPDKAMGPVMVSSDEKIALGQ